MSVRVTEAATVLALSRVDFAALLAHQDPSAFRLKRRLAALFTARLRNQLRRLAVSLGGEVAGPPAEDAARAFAELEYCGPPDSKYARRMATFHDFDSLALWGFLTSGSYARCSPGRTLLAEGAPSTACYLTINGAVELVEHPLIKAADPLVRQASKTRAWLVTIASVVERPIFMTTAA